MMLDAGMSVELLQGKDHSCLVCFWKAVVSLLSTGGKQQSSNAEEPQEQSSHLSPCVCNSGNEEESSEPPTV